MKLFVIVDMVNGFVEEGALADTGIRRIVPKIEDRLKKALADGDMVVAFRDCHQPNDKEFELFPPHCIKGTRESELIDSLKPYQDRMIVIDKNTTNGFNTKEFKRLIAENDFSQIEISGCCSDICVSDLTFSLAKHFAKNMIDCPIVIDEEMIDTFNGENHNADKINKQCIDSFKKIGINVIEKGDKRAKLASCEKITDKKFLNLFVASYQTSSGKDINYEIVSRRKKPQIEKPTLKVDAVNVLPYQYKDGKTFIYLIREFRYPLNDYVYGLPSGLVEEGENGKDSAIRELEEEIGAKVINIERTMTPAYTSCGMTDENMDFYQAEVEASGAQKLDANEDIEVVKVELKDLELLLNSRNMGTQGKLQLKVFMQNQKIKDLQEKLAKYEDKERSDV